MIDEMYNCILKRQPKSYNNWQGTSKKAGYKSAIENAFKQFNLIDRMFIGELYGSLYYFFKKDLKIDADNLSKPLWDCLTGFLFKDDNQIKLRIVGSFNLSKYDYNIVDFSRLSGDIIVELLDAFDKEDHVVYVECGCLNYSMFKFGLGKDGN